MTSTPPYPTGDNAGEQSGTPAAPSPYNPPAASNPYAPPASSGSAYPPPPANSPYASPNAPAQPVAPFWVWAFVGLAVLGIVALVLPWFHPKIGSTPVPGIKDLHSWDGVLFFIVPILMLVSAVRAVMGRDNIEQFRQASIVAIISGVLLLGSALYGYARVPSHYSDWDQGVQAAKEVGQTLSRGPLIGWYLSLGVAVLFIGLGIAGLRAAKKR